MSNQTRNLRRLAEEIVRKTESCDIVWEPGTRYFGYDRHGNKYSLAEYGSLVVTIGGGFVSLAFMGLKGFGIVAAIKKQIEDGPEKTVLAIVSKL